MLRLLWRLIWRGLRQRSLLARLNKPVAVAVALYFYRLTKAGGAERIICQLAGALAERGFDVHLVSWDTSDAQAFYPLHTTVRWTKLGFCPGISDKLCRTRALARLLKEGNGK